MEQKKQKNGKLTKRKKNMGEGGQIERKRKNSIWHN
jgi:hypothetical protein